MNIIAIYSTLKNRLDVLAVAVQAGGVSRCATYLVRGVAADVSLVVLTE
jgi:hypothetical protein